MIQFQVLLVLLLVYNMVACQQNTLKTIEERRREFLESLGRKLTVENNKTLETDLTEKDSPEQPRTPRQRDFLDILEDSEDTFEFEGSREPPRVFSARERNTAIGGILTQFDQFGTKTLLGRSVFGLDESGGNVVQVLESSSQFSVFIKTLINTGLYEGLKESGPFTVFAVSNSAFSQYSRNTLKALFDSKTELRRVLLRHVSRQRISSLSIPSGVSQIDMADRKKVTIGSLGGRIALYSCNGAAQVVEMDHFTSNGIIHIVDDIL
ncbi:periostin isoform X2 [Eurytemora carolleeae]|uniref:periostin isoform X2 n=1 Tax=Eurytemora carolleeae TaxID=1294199 RepID=UPI000C770028|nr:periostin isoform X2 [Eurytemora carolleeae]|eukprot:XP_023338492.1 periostin-like isoform X2 [Eurytemora affinis]